ncbi:metalloregulator ArsR/SmtB family transcription factor [Erysipelothrix sp. D19-032]|uniref:ArsR/SmtB family transcription factor n=1 Tax=Erysipelothrix anatis TaxID=2683713 RepID=UPI00135AD959|nr:metalloregulator ArsR/SmtB family transcription factor [Erysipelothrix anatis]
MKDICEINVVHVKQVEEASIYINSINLKSRLDMYKALADENRLKILFALRNQEKLCVCDLAHVIEATNATTSHHLQILKKMGVLKSEREGKLTFYSLANKTICDFLNYEVKMLYEK